MMTLFLLALFLPSAVLAVQLEKSVVSQQHHHKGIEFTDVVGPFPTNPTYAAIYYYESAGCNTQLTVVRTGLLDTCFIAKDGTTMKATCTASGLTQTFYSDSNCQTVSTTAPPVVSPTNCSASNSGSIYDSYAIADCTNFGTNGYFAYPAGFVVHTWYDSSVCTSDEVVVSKGYVNNYCLQATTTASLEFQSTIYNIWSTSPTCQGSYNKQEIVSDICILADDDGYAPYGTYNNWIITSSSSSSSDDSLSTGEIAGIVVGGVVALAIVAGLIYYFVFVKGASGPLSSQGGDSRV